MPASLLLSRNNKPWGCPNNKHRQSWIPTWWINGFNIRKIRPIKKLVYWKCWKSRTRNKFSVTFILNWWRWWVSFYASCRAANSFLCLCVCCWRKSVHSSQRCKYRGSCAFICTLRLRYDCKKQLLLPKLYCLQW